MLLYPLIQKLPTLSKSVLFWATLLLQGTWFVVNGQDADIDKYIQEVFPTPPGTLLPITNSSCTCVPFFKCNKNNTINTDGAGLLDLRFKETPCSFLETCCYNLNGNNPSVESKVPDVPKTFSCGKWNSDGLRLVINGNDQNKAKLGEFPWMVAVLKQDKIEKKKIYLCGASLIHPMVVMTAVHCIHDKTPSDLVIRAGEWDTQTKNELYPFQDAWVSKIVKHEKYSAENFHNEIALIFLIKQFNLTDNVGTICLPPRNFQFNRERCYVSGWGKDVSGNGNFQLILKKINLTMIPDNTCENQLKQTWLGPNFQLPKSNICAVGKVGKDPCLGDGGSPLVCPTPENPKQFHQSGIVAWGIGCGEKSPGVYVDVSHFRLWIDQQMFNNGYNTSSYDAYHMPTSRN